MVAPRSVLVGLLAGLLTIPLACARPLDAAADRALLALNPSLEDTQAVKFDPVAISAVQRTTGYLDKIDTARDAGCRRRYAVQPLRSYQSDALHEGSSDIAQVYQCPDGTCPCEHGGCDESCCSP